MEAKKGALVNSYIKVEWGTAKFESKNGVEHIIVFTSIFIYKSSLVVINFTILLCRIIHLYSTPPLFYSSSYQFFNLLLHFYQPFLFIFTSFLSTTFYLIMSLFPSIYASSFYFVSSHPHSLSYIYIYIYIYISFFSGFFKIY